MNPDIKSGNDALRKGDLEQARACFSRALLNTSSAIEEGICVKRLKEIGAAEKEMRGHGVLKISSEDCAQEHTICCLISYTTVYNENAGLAKKIFTYICNPERTNVSNITVTLASKTNFSVSFKGTGKDQRCDVCGTYRKKLLSALGVMGAFVEGVCPEGINTPALYKYET